MGIQGEREFGSLLKSFRNEAQLTLESLAKSTESDPVYLRKLETGVRLPPRYDLLLVIAEGLKLSSEDRDKLFKAADYAPPSVILECRKILQRYDPELD